MNRRHFLTFTAIGALAACGTWKVDYPTTPTGANDWKVTSVNVTVPEALIVSADNALNPSADIVWWEGNRAYGKVRVDEIVTQGAQAAASKTNGSRPVRLAITLVRFHGMTPRATARLQVSGVHNVHFVAQIFDAATGAALTSAENIHADVPALHGEELNNANQRGLTDRVRVTNAISKAVAGWLGAGPDVRESFSMIGS